MSVSIVNLMNRPVTLILNNKQAIHMGANAVLKEIPDSQVSNNNLLEKMKSRKVISITKSSPGKEEAATKPSARAKAAKAEEAKAEESKPAAADEKKTTDKKTGKS